jgi:hypothetical protein
MNLRVFFLKNVIQLKLRVHFWNTGKRLEIDISELLENWHRCA